MRTRILNPIPGTNLPTRQTSESEIDDKWNVFASRKDLVSNTSLLASSIITGTAAAARSFPARAEIFSEAKAIGINSQ